MERGSIILATGFTVMIGVYTLTMSKVDVRTSDNAVSYANKRQARQIALSGTQIAINKLRSNSNFPGLSSGLLGGTLTLNVVDIGGNKRKVYSRATFGAVPDAGYVGETHQTVSVVQIHESASDPLFDALRTEVALSVQGRNFEVEGGKFFIDGRNLRGSAESKYAIGATPGLGWQKVHNELIQPGEGVFLPDSVIGIDPNCHPPNPHPSGFTLAPLDTVNMYYLVQRVQENATVVYRNSSLGTTQTRWGTMADPEIVYVTTYFTIDKQLRGAGILCINGDLNIIKDTGLLEWDGYVIVYGNTFRSDEAGRAVINGAVFYGKGGSLVFGCTAGSRLKIEYNDNVMSALYYALVGGEPGEPSLVRVFD